jgi:hypothetical protein
VVLVFPMLRSRVRSLLLLLLLLLPRRPHHALEDAGTGDDDQEPNEIVHEL